MTRPWDPFAPAKPAEPAVVETEKAPVDADGDDDGNAPDFAAILAEIPENLDDIHKDDLQALAALAGVPDYGTKAAIAQRIKDTAST